MLPTAVEISDCATSPLGISLLIFSHFDGCTLVSHWDFNLGFPGNWWCWASFHVPLGHSYILLWELSVQISCPFFIIIIIFLLYNTELVLPYTNMHPPWVYTCSPSWTPLSCPFLTGWLCSYNWVVWGLDTNDLSVVWNTNIVSHSVLCLFTFTTVSFSEQEL